MAITQLGALRFYGDEADVPNLPINSTVTGASFDALDTLKRYIFTGIAWEISPDQTPLSAKGDLFTFDTADARLPVGAPDQILIANPATPTGLEWVANPSFLSPLTTDGDIMIYNATDVRLGIGTVGQVLTVSALGFPEWAVPLDQTPLTTKGDMLGFTTLDVRLPVGTDGQVLSANSVQAIGLEWIDPPAGTSPLTTKGDLYTFSTLDVALPIGLANQILSVDLAEATGLKWIDNTGGAGGGITGLNPNSTILEYSTDIDDYTTPTDATATSEDGANVALNAINNNTGDFWKSNAGINESIFIDMGSVVNAYGLAYYIDKSQMTETQFQIKTAGTTTPIFEDDFTSYADDTAFAVVYPTTDATDLFGDASANEIVWNVVRSTTQIQTLYTDPFALNLSNEKWTFQCIANWSNVGDVLTWFIVSDNISNQNVAQDSLGFYIFNSQSNPLRSVDTDGVLLPTGLGTDNTAFIPSLGVDYYITIARTSTTSMEVDISTGAYLSTSVASLNWAISALIINQRYPKFCNFVEDTVAGSTNLVIKELNVYDEVSLFTEPTPTPVTGRTLRTIEVADLVDLQYNFIRFNGASSKLFEIVGSSGNSLVMSANELAVQIESDPPLTIEHGQFTIEGTNPSLPLNGGDPTSSVINDPAVNSITLNGTVTQGNPPTGASNMWVEPIDANNDGIFVNIKQAGVFVKKQVSLI